VPTTAVKGLGIGKVDLELVGSGGRPVLDRYAPL